MQLTSLIGLSHWVHSNRFTDNNALQVMVRKHKEPSDATSEGFLFNTNVSNPSTKNLIPPENVASINLVSHVVQAAVIPVGYDRVALGLEGREVVHHTAAEEGRAVLQ